MDFTHRRSGINGCELINRNGEVFAWTVSFGWAAILTDMLNVICTDDLEGVCQNMDEEINNGS